MRDVKSLVESVLADPPSPHPLAPNRVWATDRDCYELLASRVLEGSHTLETGCGVSTALFAACGAHHSCVVPDQSEADAVLAWCARHDVSTDRLTFHIDFSQQVLPTLPQDPLDVIFIDGEHVFPHPVIDWFYTIRRLRHGGLFVIDDIQLAAPRLVADYLAGSALLRTVARTPKWAAFEVLDLDPSDAAWLPAPAGAPLIRGGMLERIGRRADRLLSRVGASATGSLRRRRDADPSTPRSAE